jgi:hypothetical protein
MRYCTIRVVDVLNELSGNIELENARLERVGQRAQNWTGQLVQHHLEII